MSRGDAFIAAVLALVFIAGAYGLTVFAQGYNASRDAAKCTMDGIMAGKAVE